MRFWLIEHWIAFIGSGFFCSIVSKSVCLLWEKEDVDMLIVNGGGGTHKYCEVGPS